MKQPQYECNIANLTFQTMKSSNPFKKYHLNIFYVNHLNVKSSKQEDIYLENMPTIQQIDDFINKFTHRKVSQSLGLSTLGLRSLSKTLIPCSLNP
ncbi:MAG: hypothetical protein Q8830_03050, partial [Candidatus Phytoplasma australasiaticum]|nr:hypothetical protein [Candidatus Phytoplasma australasiaticum]